MSADGLSRKARARIATLEDEVARYHGKLEGARCTLAGEADELAARRPHPDEHLYDVEEQLRWKAEDVKEFEDEHVR